MRKEKSQQITIKIMARAVIFGGLFGGVMLILMLFLSSFFVLKMKSLSQTAVFAAAIISSWNYCWCIIGSALIYNCVTHRNNYFIRFYKS